MKKHNPALIFGIFIIALLGGCVAGGSPQGRVAIVDGSSRSHLQTRLTMADLLDFSERLTNKMLSSAQVAGWGASRPRLIIGDLKNDTYDENIRVGDIEEKITETVFNSGLVRVVGESAVSFDYIVTMKLIEQRQGGADGRELAEYLLRMQLKAIDGELVGSWSDILSLAKAERRLF